jgi:hypothetical protein
LSGGGGGELEGVDGGKEEEVERALFWEVSQGRRRWGVDISFLSSGGMGGLVMVFGVFEVRFCVANV